jgi:hypothetical protein
MGNLDPETTRGTAEVPLILWAWQLVIVCQVQLECDPESRMPLSGTPSS